MRPLKTKMITNEILTSVSSLSSSLSAKPFFEDFAANVDAASEIFVEMAGNTQTVSRLSFNA